VRIAPQKLIVASALAGSLALPAWPQAPVKKPAPPTSAAKPPAPAPAAPQSKHYPILIIAHGNEPNWSLRVGMKGPERLDRAGYPPIVLEAVDVAREGTADVWTYHAKDTATGAEVSVQLTRESCSDAAAGAGTPSSTTPAEKFPFRAVVTHAQIGTLNGCGRSSPELFPEFRAKNLDKDDQDKPPDDTKKKTVLDPITKFKMPAAVAYFDATGKIILSRGAVKKTAAPKGADLCVSHDGKKLLFTHDEKGAERTMSEFDFDTSLARELLHGNVRTPVWSPDDSQIAFLKFADPGWQVWSMPAVAPEKAALLYSGNVVLAIAGWADPHTVIVDDFKQLSWIGEDGTARQTLVEKEPLGDVFNFASLNTFRIHPLNPDLMLVSVVAVDASMASRSTFFLYEIRSKRRVLLAPPNLPCQHAEWSRDGLQIFFTGTDASGRSSTYRMFWDGTGLQKYSAGTNLVIGQ